MTITTKRLESKIYLLNEVTDHPTTSWQSQGHLEIPKANKGHYFFREAHGLFYLCQIANEKGLEKDTHHIFYGKTKRELYKQIEAMIDGVRIGKNCADRLQGATS